MKKDNILIGIFISVFIINYTVRQIIGSAVGIDKYYNILLLIFMILFLFNKNTIKNRRKLLFLLVITLVIFIGNVVNGLSIGYYLNPFFNFILPMVLICVTSVIDNKETYIKIMGITNKLIYIITILGVLDYLSGYKLNFLLRSFIANEGLKDLMEVMSSYGTYRLFNALGHPLVNQEYFFIYFAINWVASKWLDFNVNMMKVNIIFFIGVFLCGSKMALILAVIIVFFYSGRSRNINLSISFFCFSIVGLILFVNTNGFKENIGNRIIMSIESGDFTNGRLGAINKVIELSEDRPGIILGKGYGYSTQVTERVKINNFEFPPLMMAYDYGILVTVFIYSICFIAPIIKFVRKKQFLSAGIILILVLYFNSFNGLVYGDSFARLLLTIKIFIDISNLKNEDGVVILSGKEKY